MLKKANIQWSGKTLRNQIEKGQVFLTAQFREIRFGMCPENLC